ncbi:MAG: N-acetylneuraminate synthase family protein [Candidatus Bathyarchaeota archaeon]|nr:N-acetylneuraminate synthase family protein [Candidatus Bathyarchaeota archaeon]
MKRIKVRNKILDERSGPFIVAEAGVNYENDMGLAKKLINEAASAGADAIKFQTYKAEKIASRISPAYWKTKRSQYAYFKKYDKFAEEEFRELAEYAKDKHIIFMSTPFDFDAVDFLDELVPAFKISSSDITNTPFIKHIARKKKPIFLSTGASTIGEIEDALNAIEVEGNEQIVILHCVLSYPTRYEDANLNMITHLRKAFPTYLVGYSDHTLPDRSMLTLTTAALLGAKVLEKHFTLDKSLEDNDHYHAMDFHDLGTLVENMRLLEKILGEEGKKPLDVELPARKYARRSIVARKGIPKGAEITRNMLTFKRPGTGISPKFLELVIGRIARKNIKGDEVIEWEYI